MKEHQPEPAWDRQPFTPWEFSFIFAIPIGFVIMASAILFLLVIRFG